MSTIRLKYVNSYIDSRGKLRHYYRRNGQRIPLSADNLLSEYSRVHESFQNVRVQRVISGSFGALVELYYMSAEIAALRNSTKVEYKRLINKVNDKWRDVPLIGLTRRALLAYRDKLADTPVTANNTMRVLSTLLSFAVDRGLLKENPIQGLRKLKVQSEGWRPWSDDQLEIFERLAEGASRVAFLLALYTGQRRGDILKLRWDQIKDGCLFLTQEKTQKTLVIPLHPHLQKELEMWRVGRKIVGPTIVHKQDGRAYTDDGFGTIWNREQTRLGVKAPFHGLRKNATIALIEAGCTPQEAQAITGHETLDMLNHYAKRVDQRRLAETAISKLERNT